MSPSENLTRDEARGRAARIGGVHTRVLLDLTRRNEVFGSSTEIEFQVLEPGPSFVDLTARSVEHAELDHQPVAADDIEATRIHLPELPVGAHRLRVDAAMAYQHEGRGLHRFVDPADQAVYLHSQFEPFDAHLVYACFDQPDIKTTFDLAVDAPAGWVVVSNGAVVERPDEGQSGRWCFATTPPLPTYVTAVVAGPYVGVHDRRGELDLGLYVRRSLGPYLDPDELFEVTRSGLDLFERVFDQPYPFDKYDQLFVPEFSAGAMENPGCVTLSETYVFRSKVTDALRERRAETILHELAHMWFGDLVTMRWWDDLWLNESFATFMAVFAQVEATRWSNAWVTFLDAEKSWAKYQDQLPSTHPVADEMPDVESVHQNFDGITYAKGASVLRQLVAWVGEEAFLAGCRDYFARHAWGNTELADFLAALERTSGRDLDAWRDEWLTTTGCNTLTAEIETAEDGTYASVAVVQRADPPRWSALAGVEAPPPILRRHRIALGVYRDTDEGIVRERRIELDVTGERTEVTGLAGTPAGALLLVNDDDLTYGKVVLDAASIELLTHHLHRLGEPLPRALAWSSAWDMLRDAELPASRFVELVVHNVAHESEIGVLQRILGRGLRAVQRYADPAAHDTLMATLAHHARSALDAAPPGSDHQLALARHWASCARGDATEIEDVRRLLDGDLMIGGLTVDTDLRWHLVVSLAVAGRADDELIKSELRRDPTDLGQRQAATARAARPTPTAKQAAWRQLLEDRTLSHTMSRQLIAGFSQLDQDEVLEPFTSAYFEVLDDVWAQRSLDWAIEFTEGVFPHHAASEAVLANVDDLLARGDLQRPRRRVLLEQRDTLARTLAARALDRATTGG